MHTSERHIDYKMLLQMRVSTLMHIDGAVATTAWHSVYPEKKQKQDTKLAVSFPSRAGDYDFAWHCKTELQV